jgi:hypothetical protein
VVPNDGNCDLILDDCDSPSEGDLPPEPSCAPDTAHATVCAGDIDVFASPSGLMVALLGDPAGQGGASGGSAQAISSTGSWPPGWTGYGDTVGTSVGGDGNDNDYVVVSFDGCSATPENWGYYVAPNQVVRIVYDDEACAAAGDQKLWKADGTGRLADFRKGAAVVVRRADFSCLFVGPPGYDCASAERAIDSGK